MYQFSADRNAVFDAPSWNATWKKELGAVVNGGLSLLGTTLYVESFDSKLHALDALTGTERWSQLLPDIAMNSPLIVNGLVITGTGTNRYLNDTKEDPVTGDPAGDYVQAFDAHTGAPVWQYRTVGADMPTGSLVTAGSATAFVFSNADGHAYALDSRDGSVLWTQSIRGLASMSSLAAADGRIYGTSTYYSWKFYSKLRDTHNFDLYHHGYTFTWALRAGDGRVLWTVPYGFADCSPAVGGGAVFVQGHFYRSKGEVGYNEVYALDAATGALRWKYVSPVGPTPPMASGERSIAGLYSPLAFFESLPFDREFAAFEPKTGRIRWLIPTHDAVKMSAVLKEGMLYFGDTAGYFYVVRASDGRPVATIKFPEMFTTSPPVIVGSTLFVANGKTIYAIPVARLQQGTPL